MIGPSSSHTAGAVKLGQVARALVLGDVARVEFLLHGSFAMTYRGHGTDRALLAGLMGMTPSSGDIKNALEIATERGIEYHFIPTDLGDVHPNTVRIVITRHDGVKRSVTGCSVGGGNIRITALNEDEVDFTGDYPTLLIKYTDVPGMIATVTKALAECRINIAFMRVFRSSKGRTATMVFETDESVPDEVVERLRHLSGVHLVIFLKLMEVQ